MRHRTDDLRIQSLRPLLPPAILMEEVPVDEAGTAFIAETRGAVAGALHGQDDRLLVVVGPCSIHDPEAALDYARRLRAAADALREDLLIVMRVYFEKPRSTVGWKGLSSDPYVDGSFAISEGLRRARRLLLDSTAMCVAAGTEFLDPIMPQFIADLVSWGAIGARTSESQVHRELASGLSMAVGIKNGTDGSLQVAIDAVRSAMHPHHFLSVTKEGVAAILATLGNRDCHVILRGGTNGPNFSAAAAASAPAAPAAAAPAHPPMGDSSPANRRKNHL